MALRAVAMVFETEYVKESRVIGQGECHFKLKVELSSHVALFSNITTFVITTVENTTEKPLAEGLKVDHRALILYRSARYN